ncbi:glycosyltransferase [Mariprofundus ferrooxydans]|uniref:glycosyltransferase n=1 Tax=Mariprofundus ferrooxydans TaxID=314344 RepID=UPI0014315CF0|nr:glycosyltransferase [Mariprofundus ferrooxydans]
MTKKEPLVSIVIPVYNGSNYLGKAIESALGQTYRNIEIIVVNDGSTDDGETEDIALSYGEQIRYYWKENGGVSTALNLAIKNMHGDYFSWLSHDDIYLPDKVAKEVKYISAIGRDAVIYSNYCFIDAESRFIREVNISEDEVAASFREALLMGAPIHGCTALVPRGALEYMGGFNEALRTTQDYDLWFRMSEKCDFLHIPEVLVQSRVHTEQGSLTLKSIVQKENESLYKMMLERFVSSGTMAGDAADFYLRAAIALYRRKGAPKASRMAMGIFLKNADTSEREAGNSEYFKAIEERCQESVSEVLRATHGRLDALGALVRVSIIYPDALKLRFFWGGIRKIIFSWDGA